MLAAAKAAFLPEFLNRIDEIVTFAALTPAQVERDRRADGRAHGRAAARRARDRAGGRRPRSSRASRGTASTPQFGARPLQRHVRRTLERALTQAILDGRLTDGSSVRADVDEQGEVVLTVAELARVAA